MKSKKGIIVLLLAFISLFFTSCDSSSSIFSGISLEDASWEVVLIVIAVSLVLLFCFMKFIILNSIIGILINILNIIVFIMFMIGKGFNGDAGEFGLCIGLIEIFIYLMDAGPNGVADTQIVTKEYSIPIISVFWGVEYITEKQNEVVGDSPIGNFIVSLIGSAIFAVIFGLVTSWICGGISIIRIIFIIYMIIRSIMKIVHFVGRFSDM